MNLKKTLCFGLLISVAGGRNIIAMENNTTEQNNHDVVEVNGNGRRNTNENSIKKVNRFVTQPSSTSPDKLISVFKVISTNFDFLEGTKAKTNLNIKNSSEYARNIYEAVKALEYSFDNHNVQSTSELTNINKIESIIATNVSHSLINTIDNGQMTSIFDSKLENGVISDDKEYKKKVVGSMLKLYQAEISGEKTNVSLTAVEAPIKDKTLAALPYGQKHFIKFALLTFGFGMFAARMIPQDAFSNLGAMILGMLAKKA